MGGLHSWCLAATRPELVTALVVEDMAPDFRGRTTGPWEPWLHALPVEFDSAQEVYDEFGPSPGATSSRRSTAPRPGWRLHGHTERWIEIAAEWGTRDYWQQWRAVRAPDAAHRGGQLGHPAGPDARMAETGHRATYLTCPAPVTSSTTTRRGYTARRSKSFLATFAGRA